MFFSHHPHRRLFLLGAAFLLVATVGVTESVVVEGMLRSEARALRMNKNASSKSVRSAKSASSALSRGASKLLRGVASSKSSVAKGRPAVRSSYASVEAVYIKNTVPEKARCGDSLVIAEGCDDGNTNNNDGCSSTCTIETGFVCNGAQPSTCWSTCGDAVKATNEKCDDGNLTEGDGCSDKCINEVGYICTGTAPSVCEIPAFCGDRHIDSGETCDDGNNNAGDGCTAGCQIE